MKDNYSYRAWRPPRQEVASERTFSVWWKKPEPQVSPPHFSAGLPGEVSPTGQSVACEHNAACVGQEGADRPPPREPAGVASQSVPPAVGEQAPAGDEQRARWEEKLGGLAQLLVRIEQGAAEIMTECVLAVAGKLLRRKAQLDRSWLIGNLQRCLARNPPNGKITLRLHPADLQAIKQMETLPAWLHNPSSSLELAADEQLEPGDCILESSRARVDARLAVQLEKLRPLLQDVVRAALSGGESR